ncbi:hypothetical protein SCHPADRAFT_998700 [Schizopora paradoxa]|uniref:Uncharacterized protein n=1 Tax=Schizopora paradoxa TaxID=27342 RepID=A0A0H2RIS5_9AGAM|nr:hypothetical protein SCHPADRAFT_998700 [Schizopora paradoxa]
MTKAYDEKWYEKHEARKAKKAATKRAKNETALSKAEEELKTQHIVEQDMWKNILNVEAKFKEKQREEGKEDLSDEQKNELFDLKGDHHLAVGKHAQTNLLIGYLKRQLDPPPRRYRFFDSWDDYTSGSELDSDSDGEVEKPVSSNEDKKIAAELQSVVLDAATKEKQTRMKTCLREIIEYRKSIKESTNKSAARLRELKALRPELRGLVEFSGFLCDGTFEVFVSSEERMNDDLKKKRVEIDEDKRKLMSEIEAHGGIEEVMQWFW